MAASINSHLLEIIYVSASRAKTTVVATATDRRSNDGTGLFLWSRSDAPIRVAWRGRGSAERKLNWSLSSWRIKPHDSVGRDSHIHFVRPPALFRATIIRSVVPPNAFTDALHFACTRAGRRGMSSPGQVFLPSRHSQSRPRPPTC